MPKVTFTQHLQRHVSCPPSAVGGETVRQALDAVFTANERLRGYVLDDQGAVRRHVAIFIDGEPIQDRRLQTDAVGPGAEIYVMQALSGG